MFFMHYVGLYVYNGELNNYGNKFRQIRCPFPNFAQLDNPTAFPDMLELTY